MYANKVVINKHVNNAGEMQKNVCIVELMDPTAVVDTKIQVTVLCCDKLQ